MNIQETCILNNFIEDEQIKERMTQTIKLYSHWNKKFIVAKNKTIQEKESSNKKFIETKILATSELNMKSGDPMDFPLWSKYIEKEIVQNDNFTELEKIIKIKSMLPNDFVLIFDYERPSVKDVLEQINKRYDSELLVANSIRKKINNLNILDERSKAEDWNQALSIAEAINILNKQGKEFAAKELSKNMLFKIKKNDNLFADLHEKDFTKKLLEKIKKSFESASNKEMFEPQTQSKTKNSALVTIEKSCFLCNGKHPSFLCNLPRKEKFEKAKEKKLCFKCLGKFNHFHTNCKKGRRCNCEKKMNITICPCQEDNKEKVVVNKEKENKEKSQILERQSSISQESTTGKEHAAVSAGKETKSFLSIIELFAVNNKRKQKVFALLDGCATISSISSNLAKKLRIESIIENETEVQGYGSISTGLQRATQIYFESLNGVKFGPDKILIGPEKILDDVDAVPNYILEKAKTLGLFPISPSSESSPIRIDALFGLDWLFQHILSPVSERKFVDLGDGFEAYETKIGTVIHGVSQLNKPKKIETSFCIQARCPVEDIKNILYDPTAPDIENNEDDKKWFEDYRKKIRLNEKERRIYAPLPWLNENRPENNYKQIVKLLPSLIYRLKKNDMLEKYTEQLDLFVNNSFAEVLDGNKTDGFFLNHFPVIRRGTTYDVRPVFNASFKRGKNKSLNDFLYKGNLMGLNLIKMLLFWRFYQHVLLGDIQKAFLQVKVENEDRKYLRYLWEKDGKLLTIQFSSVIFGATSSPFILESAINKLLEKKDPELTKTIYMDDILFVADNLGQLYNRYINAEEALSLGSMKIHKFTARKTVIEFFGLRKIEIEEKDSTKILGLVWNLEQDEIIFGPPKKPEGWSLRTVSSFFSSLFDPLGLLTPFQLSFRQFIRDLHLSKINWDEPLNQSFILRAEKLAKQMDDLKRVHVPRVIFQNNGQRQNLCLHVFVDASRIAYGACAYIYNEEIGQLLMSKVRLVSETKRTIPQLELTAALEGVKLFVKIKKELPQIRLGNLFSDSMVTLARISGSPNNLPLFESNRVREIQSLIEPQFWKFISTKENPADCLSRGLPLNKLINHSLWWTGPKLSSFEKHSQVALVKKSSTKINQDTFVENICDINFRKALLIIERLLAWMSFRTKDSKKLNLQPLHHLIKLVQRQSFKMEFHCLSKQQTLPKTSVLYKWPVFVDDNGLIRLKRRIENCQLSFNEKFPIILIDKAIVRDMLKEIHINTFHGGIFRTVEEVRKNFYVPKLYFLVKNLIAHCKKCQRLRGKAYSFESPPLPRGRTLIPKRAFCNIGIDLFINKEMEKMKIFSMIFVCANSRAIHLDIVQNRGIESVFQCLTRFISLYGLPEKIWSDNEKSFSTSKKILSKLFFAKKKVQHNYNVNWDFNPPAAPWYGGFYERLIRSVKDSLSVVVIKGHSQESFRTLLAEIQGVINDRPLFRSSDGTFVTPYHLIFGNERSTLFSSVNIVNFEHDKLTLLYEKLVGNIKKFWEIWSSSYLTELKNFRSEKGITPRVGDLAFFKAEQRRQDWPVVEILELNETGRVAKILDISNEKTYHRSIRCLVPLEGENVVN